MSIEKKLIMAPQKSGSILLRYYFILYGIIFLWLFVGTKLGFFAAIGVAIAVWIFTGLMAYIPLSMFANKKLQKLLLVETKEKFAEFVGKPVKYSDVSVSGSNEGIVGTGIAYDDGTIYIMDQGVAAKFNWDVIRKWEWSIPGHTTFYGTGGLTSAQTTLLANAQSRTQAYLDSGFFIDVIDIEKPRWQFMSSDEKVLTKWMEIFTQIKEGKLV